MSPAPRPLAHLPQALSESDPAEGGAVWRLAEAGRELDANLVRLPAGEQVGEHREDTLDVLLLAVDGTGTAGPGAAGPGEPAELTPGTLLWLPRGAPRTLEAGPRGLAYLTVHRRRPGMSVGGTAPVAAPDPAGGEPACLLPLVCEACGRVSADPRPRYCSQCGEPFPGAEA
ncbi:cupin domain-containing protein [Streptomyces sp. NPDC007088]|uniref:cupin domain-containing protein n=1 Tax=Streptomyces sp. NPDC007088 TaxID=3364773 RepID=UPI00367D6B6C